MSLKSFHIFFITVAAILAVIMGIWGFHSYVTAGSGLGTGILGVVVILLLIPYARWFRKKAAKMPLSVLLPFTVVLASKGADACSVCFGDPNSLMVQGIKSGVWVLLACITFVLVCIASIAVKWTRRAQRLALESQST